MINVKRRISTIRLFTCDKEKENSDLFHTYTENQETTYV